MLLFIEQDIFWDAVELSSFTQCDNDKNKFSTE